MWMLIARAPAPDMPYWPGRRFVALLDALVWPMLVAAVVINLPHAPGLVGPVALAVSAFFGARRAAVALWNNSRYRFTTIRVGAPLAALLVLGAMLKFAM